jgi:hypothetical protein
VNGVPCFNCVNGINGSVGSTQSLVRFNRNVVTELNFFFQVFNYSGPATNGWAIVRLPSTVIAGAKFDFNIANPNVISSIEWTNAVIPAGATAGDALMFSVLVGGANTDVWYQYIKLKLSPRGAGSPLAGAPPASTIRLSMIRPVSSRRRPRARGASRAARPTRGPASG